MGADDADRVLIEDMKQRELTVKRKQRAADAIVYEERRFRGVLAVATGIGLAALAALVFFALLRRFLDREGWWLPACVAIALCLALGIQLGQRLLRSRAGRKILARNEDRVREKYSTELNAGRRWHQFYYQDEDIAPYVPQVLYFLEADQRFDSVDDALAFAKQSQRESPFLAAQALKRFEDVAAAANSAVISSIDRTGRPSGRMMRFVTSARPGVWYVTTAPEGPKVREFDQGRVAVVTVPTQSGAMISSNRVVIRRADLRLADVADLYRAQVPGYLDGMTEGERARELVYELTFQSAKVDTWLDHKLVEFPEAPQT